MTLTRHRTFQYVGILLALAAIAAGYWYFSVRAGVKTNTSGSQPQGVGDLSAGLAGYWKLDENTGTSAGDASTNGNTGTLTNGPTWTTGQIGSAVSFDGTNDEITSTNNQGTAANLKTLTLSVWFKTSTASGKKLIGMEDVQTGTGATNNDRQIWMGTDGKIRFAVYASALEEVVSTTTLNDNTWHHAVGVSTGDNGTLYLYIDGALQGTNSVGSTIFTYANSYWRIGGYENSAWTNGADGYFTGQLDEVRVYSRPLSADEVTSLYRLTTPTGVDTSLKGYWSFNGEALSGTTAYDWSGAGNNGTLTNGPTVTDGRVGQALDFDGSNDNVTVADTSALTGSALTVAFWKKDTNALQNRSFVTKSSAGQRSWSIQGDDVSTGNGDTAVRFYTATGLAEVSTYGTTPPVMTAGKWHHVVAVFDGSGSGNSGRMQIYIDGVAQSLTFSGTIPASLQDNTTALLIAEGGLASTRFLGQMDEVRTYNRAMTAAEIKALYDRGSADKTNTSAGQAQGTGRLDSGLAGYWKLDENTGTSAGDASTNGSTGTLTNGPTWTTGQIGSAVQFDGTNDYISTSQKASSRGTVSAWVNTTATINNCDYSDALRATTSDGGSSVKVRFNGCSTYNRWEFEMIGSYGATAGTVGPTYTSNSQQQGWHLVTASWDVAAGSSLYIDGVLASTSTGTTGSIASTTLLNIGGSSLVPSDSFPGKIDEVRLYDRILSADEIAELYRLTTPTSVDTGLKGYWSLNGQDISGTTAYDRSGAGNNGTLTNGPAIKWGRVGQALDFDGTNDYVNIGNPTSLQITGSMTIGSWVQFQGTPGGNDYIVVSKSDGGNTDYGWMFAAASVDNGPIQSYFEIAINSSTTSQRYSAATLEPDTWYHLVGVYDASLQTLSMYVNGVLSNGLLEGAVPASQRNATTGATIGMRPISSGFLDGSMDELRIYNRALSAAEVKAQYDAAAPDKTNTSVSTPQGTGRLDSGLIGYWKLDENTGTSASDASAAGTTGTLTGGPTWATGRIGTGVDFDGTNDYIDFGTPALLDLDTRHTVSAWINPDTLPGDGANMQIFAQGSANCCGLEYGLALRKGGGQDYIRFNHEASGNALDHQVALTTGTWHHIVGTWDGAMMRLYLNGTEVNSVAQSGTISEFNNTVYIGKADGGGYFDGKIDEVRVYNRALSADEVTQLYSVTAPTGVDTSLLGYWSFNGQDTTATTASDRSGLGNSGTLTNGPTVKWGKLGQALSFDGTDDYVTMGDINALDGLTAMTASAWVRTTSFSVERQIIAKSGCVGGTNGGVFELFGPVSGLPGQPTFAIYKNGGSPDYYTAESSLRIDDGAWHLVTGTYDGTTLRIYVDGIEAGSVSAPGVTLPSTGSSVYVGRCDSGAYWNGSIDEARVYNRALSSSEIKALYSSGR